MTDKPCNWSRDGDIDGDTWATGCGKYFSIIDGTPTDNEFLFCAYCGGRLEQLPDDPPDEGNEDD